MTEAQVIDQVRAFILENFLYMRPDAAVGDDDPLLDRRILDSMAVMELITHLKDAFGVGVPERDIREDRIGTLRRIAAYVVRARTTSGDG